MEVKDVEVAVKIRPSIAQQRFVIDDGSKVGEARRAAQTLATFEFTAEAAGKVSIAATELANNLLNHAGGGELLLQRLGPDESPVIELLAIDRGPGMTNLERCMRDGYSTSGTPGTGLGAVRRLANEFDIHSAPGEGTIVMARFGAPQPVRYGGVSVAIHGEIECGDEWLVVAERDGRVLERAIQ
jgi:anti-sigma regulatory factor (Ser/Thr protein kinase)